jgi:hypothetical protein
VRPHTLRAWTSSNLERAEREGLVTKSIREYFMGHDLKGIDRRYNVGKKLSQEQIEELREVYKRCEPYLSTSAVKETTRIDSVLRKGILIAVGYTDVDIERMKIGALDTEKFLEAITNSPAKAKGNSANPHDIVSRDVAERLVKEGWRIGRDWDRDGSRVVVERPD